MIIDRQKLISLLVDKTGLEQEQVEKQLAELVNRIQNAADEGKSFEIEGFGTFRMEDDNLQFDPSSTLQTEINNKYAGMKPIELIGAFKQPEGEEIPDMMEADDNEDAIWTFDTESVEEEQQNEAAEEPVLPAEEEKAPNEAEIESEVEEEPDRQENTTVVNNDISDETEEKTDTGDTAEEELADHKTETASVDEAEGKKSPKQKEPEHENDEEPPKVAAKKETTGDPIERFLMVAVILLVIGVGGWFIYDLGFSKPGNNKSKSQTFSHQTAKKQVPAGQGDMKSGKTADTSTGNSSGEKSEPERTSQVTKQGGSQPASNTEQDNPYGLRGSVNQSISSGYTIVVHSLKNQKKAENNRQRLQDQGFRAIIQSATVDGSMRYRVGIGQFPTVDAAEEAIEELPEPYKSNNFIKRIKQS